MTIADHHRRATTGVALIRITLGVVLLATWYDNLTKGLYNGDGLKGFLDFLFDENGNASSLTVYKSFLDAVIVPVAGVYAAFQFVVELVLGIALVVGGFTRLFSLVAAFFFLNLFLSYFGGHEWIWTYVLLFMSALAVFVGYGGRRMGLDVWLARTRGKSPFGLLW